MEQWKKVAWSAESSLLLHNVDSKVCVRHLPGKEVAPGYSNIVMAKVFPNDRRFFHKT